MVDEGVNATAASLSSGTAWSLIASIWSALGRLVSGVVVARLLGPDAAGTVYYQVWLASMVMLCASLGIPGAVQRFVAELGVQAPCSASLARLIRIAAVMIVLAGVAVAAHGWSASGIGAAMPMAVLIVLQGFEALVTALWSGRQRFAQLARWSLAGSTLQVVAVGFGAWSNGAAGALLGYAAGSLPSVVAGFMARSGSAPVVADPEVGRRALRYAIGVWIAALASALVWSRLELFFFAQYRSQAETAAYGAALTWATLAYQIPVMGLGALLPHFAGHAGAGQREAAFATYALGTKLLGAVLSPLCISAAVLSGIAIPMIFGSAFAAAAPCAMVLAAGGVLNVAAVGSSLLYGFDHSRILVVCSVMGAAAFALLDWLVIPGAGLLGAAWVRVAVQATLTAIGFWYIAARLACPVPIAALIKIVAASAVCIAFPAQAAAMALGWKAVVACVLLGVVVYALSLRWLGLFTAGEIARITAVCAILPKPLRGLAAWTGSRP